MKSNVSRDITSSHPFGKRRKYSSGSFGSGGSTFGVYSHRMILTPIPALMKSMPCLMLALMPDSSMSPARMTLLTLRAFRNSMCSSVRAVPHGAMAFVMPICESRSTSGFPSQITTVCETDTFRAAWYQPKRTARFW